MQQLFWNYNFDNFSSKKVVPLFRKYLPEFKFTPLNVAVKETVQWYVQNIETARRWRHMWSQFIKIIFWLIFAKMTCPLLFHSILFNRSVTSLWPGCSSVGRLVGWLVCRSVCLNFLKVREVTLPCFYRSY